MKAVIGPNFLGLLVAIERTKTYVRLLLGAPKAKYFRVVIRVEERKRSPYLSFTTTHFSNFGYFLNVSLDTGLSRRTETGEVC